MTLVDYKQPGSTYPPKIPKHVLANGARKTDKWKESGKCGHVASKAEVYGFNVVVAV
jgi:hypothetical protein